MQSRAQQGIVTDQSCRDRWSRIVRPVPAPRRPVRCKRDRLCSHSCSPLRFSCWKCRQVTGTSSIGNPAKAISQTPTLILGLLPPCEPLDKFGQPSRKGSLDRTVGQPQPIPKPLKLTGVQQPVQRGIAWQRKRGCRSIGREQSLHRNTRAGGTNAPLNAPCPRSCSESLVCIAAGFCGECAVKLSGSSCSQSWGRAISHPLATTNRAAIEADGVFGAMASGTGSVEAKPEGDET